MVKLTKVYSYAVRFLYSKLIALTSSMQQLKGTSELRKSNLVISNYKVAVKPTSKPLAHPVIYS